jgi:hypothetical protein
VLVHCRYSVETPDVTYPWWFNGVWETRSTTVSVEAPAGVALFGGNRSYQIAEDDVGSTISYDTRFRLESSDDTPEQQQQQSLLSVLPSASPTTTTTTTTTTMAIVADREFNIQSIVKATMGQQAVMNVPFGQEDPNRLVFVLSPAGANGTVFRAELRTIARRSEYPNPTTTPAAASSSSSSPPVSSSSSEEFHVLEAVRQIVTVDRRSLLPGQQAPPPLVKDIETTTLYTKVGEDTIEAFQRTASFLVR